MLFVWVNDLKIQDPGFRKDEWSRKSQIQIREKESSANPSSQPSNPRTKKEKSCLRTVRKINTLVVQGHRLLFEYS